MTTTIKFDDIEHTGQFSKAYVDGFVYMYMRVNHDLTDEDLSLEVIGAHQLNFDVVSDYALGCRPIGVEPGPLIPGCIKNHAQLEEYVGDYMEMDPEPDTIRRYLAEVDIEQQEIGGFERDKSFSDLVTFDDIDFIQGLYAASRILEQPQDEMFFDTATLTFITLNAIDNESQAN